MSKFIHNISESAVTYQGREIAADAFFEISKRLESEYSEDQDLIDDIMSETVAMSYDGKNDLDATPEKQVNFLKYTPEDRCPSTWAVDKGGIDQALAGTSWTKLTIENVLWDAIGDLDLENNEFVIKADGVFTFDAQIDLKDLVGVSEIELALFKKVDGQPDDYWFILSKKTEINGISKMHLNGATQFDFRTGERYYLAIKLGGSSPEATVVGDDDFTAWGCSWEMPLYES